ncbi:FAD-dependent monooxygenase [Methylobacterium sp. WL64]|uniref:FAD-dependent oxidoreductase n=1 Tax=Methylobacterium sp. WL64 TaxID=2603894 RepID=UPI0011CA4E0D|nr:NAD(P)/FAD-dependent oxidoreductase [Methylobacterium sp. WL64]TXN00741.1 FAD-dependent monooxygenase [Methylobacterium sp. WL64]
MKDMQELRREGSIAIVGAGPGGAMLARLLQMRGFNVRVFERDGSPTARPQGGSLDLRTDSGQRAIDAAELTEPFARSSREEAKAFRMVDAEGDELPGMGEDTHQDAGPEIDRGDLRQLLLDSLAPNTVAWNHMVEDVTPDVDGQWRVAFKDKAPIVADLVVGADGVGSKVRRRLTTEVPRYTGITMLAANIRRDLWRGSKIDETLGEGSVMFAAGEKTIFVQRCSHDLILLYYSLAVPEGWPKSESFDLSDTSAVLGKVRTAYADWSPDVLAMLTEVEDTFQPWPTSVMPPAHRWATQPGLTMLGDASHVMPPFTGKGVNLALLDALELADGLSGDASSDVATVIEAFETRMQARTRDEIRACLDVGRQMYGIEMDFSDPTQDQARAPANARVVQR